VTEIPYVPSKETLKANLSMPYVCAQLGITLLPDNTALCPFHQDTSPSFHLFEGDDGIERWSCYPCGQRGADIFDLIGRKLGLGFSDSLLWAADAYAQLPPGWEKPRMLARSASGPEDWADEVQQARANAAEKERNGLLSAFTGLANVDDLSNCMRWDTYLRGTWGWGINDGGIIVPHWNAAGELTGAKVRKGNGRKESLPGSRYEDLYGAFLGRRHQDILLCEGETDVVWAGYQAAVERLPLDVFGMPSGAQQVIDARWLTFLARARTIYLALDPDDGLDNGSVKGVEATRNWIDALNGAGFSDVRVCSLPYGRDLRDAQPNMRNLLQSARRPLLPPENIQATPGGYVRADAKGNLRAVTNWVVHPRARLTGAGDEGYDVVIEHRGTRRSGIVRLADLGSTREIRKWANRYGMVFTGNDPDLQRIAELINERGAITPEVFQSNQVGLRLAPEEYAFAGVGAVYPDGYHGALPWRYVPSLKGPADVSGRVLLPAEGPIDWRWIDSFLALSDTSVTHPILSWIVAAARRHECQEFPILFVGGSSGVGKSTLSRLAMRLAGSAIETGLGSVTPYILLRTLAASSTLPVFVDEWTRLSRADTREAFQGNIPVLYAGGMAERGQADLTAQAYVLSAPTIVAGEDTFALDREQDRIIAVFPTRAAQNHAALQLIQGEPIERFGNLLHSWLSSNAATGLPPIGGSQATRPLYNRAILLSGWQTLHKLLEYAAAHGDDTPQLPEFPDLSALDRVDRDDGENVYEVAMREGFPVRDQSGAAVVWTDVFGQGTWIRARALIGELRRRQWDIELPGGERAMLDYFEERYTLERRQRVTPPLGNVPVWATLVRGLQMDAEEGTVEE
jgi:hypothetical protein